MGLDVSIDKVVSLNDKHEHGLVTRARGRCYSFRSEDGVIVKCVYRRTMVGDRRNDGMPLMYALKRTNGYSVEVQSLRKIYRRGVARLRLELRPGDFDVIVPAPSSTDLPRQIAERIARGVGKGAEVHDILRKPTVGSVLATAPVTPVRRVDLAGYNQALGIMSNLPPQTILSIKSVDSRARRYFSTVDISQAARIPHGRRVLIVDDSASSGTTIRDAARLLARYFRPTHMMGLVVVGPA